MATDPKDHPLHQVPDNLLRRATCRPARRSLPVPTSSWTRVRQTLRPEADAGALPAPFRFARSVRAFSVLLHNRGAAIPAHRQAEPSHSRGARAQQSFRPLPVRMGRRIATRALA